MVAGNNRINSAGTWLESTESGLSQIRMQLAGGFLGLCKV